MGHSIHDPPQMKGPGQEPDHPTPRPLCRLRSLIGHTEHCRDSPLCSLTFVGGSSRLHRQERGRLADLRWLWARHLGVAFSS